MVGTMLPIGYGERRQGRAQLSMVAYGLGSVLGAAGLGLTASALGNLTLSSLTPSARTTLTFAVTAAAAVVLGLSDAAVGPVSIPQTRRQVPYVWYRRFRPTVTGFLYGSALGFGLGTRVPVAAFYLVPIWAVFSGQALLAMCLLVPYGVGRFLPLLLIGTSRAADPQALESLVDRLDEWQPLVGLLNGTVMSAVAAYVFVTLVRATEGL